MSNLFRKIFNRNLVKGKTDLDKMSDDLGGLQGIFSWKRVENGLVTAEQTFSNDITQLSKSTVIRLLAQGASPYVGAINPTQYSISRMRFGNAPFETGTPNYNDVSTYKALAYYNSLEKSSRANNTTGSEFSPLLIKGAGGKASGNIPAESGTNASKGFSTSDGSFPNNQLSPSVSEIEFSFSINSATFGPTSINPSLQSMPPSHKTLSVDFFSQVSFTNRLFSIQFDTIYSRNSNGNLGSFTNVAPSIVPSNYVDIAKTKLIWDSSASLWRVRIYLINPNGNDIKSAVASFKVGEYNIANSIVPAVGENSGTAANRFSGRDFYSVNPANTVYTDSPSNFIDDYSVTFSTQMNTTEGNGLGDPTVPVVYTEAFLFNGRDDLFSIVRFAPPPPYPPGNGTGFAKTDQQAYLISWTIRAII